MTYQDEQFASYAGQEVQAGIRDKPISEPMIPLEEQNGLQRNLSAIQGLIPKIGDIMFYPTRVFASPLDPYIVRRSARFGAATESAIFKSGATQLKTTGRCLPVGSVDMATSYDYVNFAYNVDLSIYDREIDAAVLSEGQVAEYVAQKTATVQKTLGVLKYRAWVQLLSDVVDGTREIAGNTQSDMAGTEVTYSPNITGYAGKVIQPGVTLAAPERGSSLELTDPADARTYVRSIVSAAEDMQYDASDYIKAAGVSNLLVSKPLFIAESKTLDAMDEAILGTSGPYIGSYSATPAREKISGVADIVEIDAFAELPTGAYDGQRLGGVLIDRDAMVETIRHASVESQRCAGQRMTGTNWQGASVLTIARVLPSAAFLLTEGA